MGSLLSTCPRAGTRMAITSATNLVEALRRHRLVEPDQLQQLERLAADNPEPRHLAKQLVQRGWLTTFQAKQVLTGRGGDLLIGPYVVLDRLGEGANGEVFKARHQAMGRVVALKILRKELMADQEAVGRFYREIEAVSQISHPNIVHPYDAGPVGTRPVLAMEFVEGVDLERLVNDSGPLPATRACDYIRQAALALQHAHERGLIHRDIKPSNLLVAHSHGPASTGVVKLLDLGLARLSQPVLGSRTTNLTLLTGNAITQGTPDYMSPEQALDFHGADIRADIYSLGCTFYFLLTGEPPFPAPNVTQKLMAHQQAQPPGLVELRRRLPSELVGVLEKMLAKKPGDRFQTPGQVAQALAGFRGDGQETADDLDHPTQSVTVPKEAAVFSAARATGARTRRRRLVIGGLLLFLLVPAAILFLLPSGKRREQLSESPAPSQPGSEASVGSATLVTIGSVSSRRKYDLGTARVGVKFRTDRDYKITALPAALEGSTLILTANDDKHATDPAHLTLVLGAPATVYVAYDKRGTRLPAWLAEGSWQATSEAISASGGDGSASPMKIYARRFAAGPVVLGGNKQAPAVGADSNYVVIVKQ